MSDFQRSNKKRFQPRETPELDTYKRFPEILKTFEHVADPFPLKSDRAFDLKIAFSRNWKTASRKLLFVLQTVPAIDLSKHNLTVCSPNTTMHHTVRNLLAESFAMARRYDPRIDPENYAVAVVNWNASHTFDQDVRSEMRAWPSYSQRVRKIIGRSKPTEIFICGDQAAGDLLPGVENIAHKRGWLFELEGIPCAHALDLDMLLRGAKGDSDKKDESGGKAEKGREADLLFYVSRNLMHLLLRKHPHSIRYVKPNPVYIGTVARFDTLMKKLESPEVKLVAFDLETRNLESDSNAIYTAQFAIDDKKGYVVPVDHPKTPFNEEELAYIKKRLRKFLGARAPERRKTLIGHTLAFDFRVIRAQLNLFVIYHDVHELTAGEHLLDENLCTVGGLKGRYGKMDSRENLRAIITSYDNDWYFTASFSKEERTTIGMFPTDDPRVLEYCLPAGELVKTPGGAVPIETLKVGDEVVSFDSETHVNTLSKVTGTLKHKPKKRLVRLSWEGGQVVVTENHPVWVESKRAYVEAGLLSPGDILSFVGFDNTATSQTARIESS